MKTTTTFLTLVSLLLCLAKCKQSHALPAPHPDPLAADRAKYIARVNDMIKGREQVTVDSVFKNLKVLGGFPAENLVFAMEKWSEALGVSCDHCHVLNEWPSDAKPEKEIARQMVNLGERINSDLRKIGGIKSDKPGVNCFTCHRGELKPARRKK
jgi:hypothetical protein